MIRINHGDVTDFLFTYAWVPTIVVGMIAALIYFGVI